MTTRCKNLITVYEHQSLKPGNPECFEERHLLALQRYYGDKGTRYFNLIHNGVKFNQHVGIIQVDSLVIEVLPKTDQTDDKGHWRKLLIGMLRAIKTLSVHTSGSSDLKLKSNSILDLYFEIFITELEKLVHKGLIKQYRRQEENSLALKGKLIFTKHIQQNLVHQEQFYVNHQTYDRQNLFNQIIYKALRLVRNINTSPALQSRIGSLLLNFPEMDDINLTEITFNRLQFNRKTECYREAINISMLLLLNYHPDISRGQNHVLALMFDMNTLWERFVLYSLKKFASDDYLIKGQVKKTFWESELKTKVGMEPDIVIHQGEKTYILDTKWKMVNGNRPSDDDLKQMYVYTKYFGSSYTALVYPDDSYATSHGSFLHEKDDEKSYPCSLIKLKLPQDTLNLNNWQRDICSELLTQISCLSLEK
jgi:5-methylcytosine-specific restriction enzyme subunit McrC